MTENETSKNIAVEHHGPTQGAPAHDSHDGHQHAPERETPHEHDDSTHHHHEAEHQH